MPSIVRHERQRITNNKFAIDPESSTEWINRKQTEAVLCTDRFKLNIMTLI